MKTKLFRNLKNGDKFKVCREDGKTAIVTVSRVQETCSGFMTRKRRWAVYGDFPWWWHFGIVAYSDERVELVE